MLFCISVSLYSSQLPVVIFTSNFEIVHSNTYSTYSIRTVRSVTVTVVASSKIKFKIMRHLVILVKQEEGVVGGR